MVVCPVAATRVHLFHNAFDELGDTYIKRLLDRGARFAGLPHMVAGRTEERLGSEPFEGSNGAACGAHRAGWLPGHGDPDDRGQSGDLVLGWHEKTVDVMEK